MRNFFMLHPRLQKKARDLQRILKTEGIFIKYSTGYRTVEEQNRLYDQGRTTGGAIVTNARGFLYESQHQWGIAVDFYLDMDIDMDGVKSDDAFNNTKGTFQRVGAVAKSIGLGWGGDWRSFQDFPHLYLKDWGDDTSILRSRYKTPDEFMTWLKPGQTKNRVKLRYPILHNSRVLTWQRKMNIGFDYVDALEEDGYFGPKSQAFAKKHYLYQGIQGAPTAVKWLQQRLRERGYTKLGVDGSFGPYTLVCVKDFQMRRGIARDGYVGLDTTYQLLLK